MYTTYTTYTTLTPTAQAALLVRAQPVYLDTETTGLGPQDQICSIAIVDHRGQTLLNSLARPTIPVPPEATRIHGLTDAMLANAPSFSSLLPLVVERTQGRPVVIYNADYDTRLLAQSWVAHHPGGPVPELLHARSITCAMRLYAHHRGEWNDERGGYRWHQLGAALAQLGQGLPPDLQPHTAQADAYATHLVLGQIARLHGQPACPSQINYDDWVELHDTHGLTHQPCPVCQPRAITTYLDYPLASDNPDCSYCEGKRLIFHPRAYYLAQSTQDKLLLATL